MLRVANHRFPLSWEARRYFTSLYIMRDKPPYMKDEKWVNDVAFGATTESPLWGSGKDGYGLTFDGTDDYAIVAATNPPTTYPGWVFCAGWSGVDRTGAGGGSQFLFGLMGQHTYNPTLTFYKGGSDSIWPNNIVCQSDIDGAWRAVGPTMEKNRTYCAALISRDWNNHKAFLDGGEISGSGTHGSLMSAGDFDYVVGGCYCVDGSTKSFFLNGGLYLAGFGTTDPGDPFFKRLTANPWAVLFSTTFRPLHAGQATVKCRKGFSMLGGRIGSRQEARP